MERTMTQAERLEIKKAILELAKEANVEFQKYCKSDFTKKWSVEAEIQLMTLEQYCEAKDWMYGIQDRFEDNSDFSYTGYFIECDIFKTDVERVYRLCFSGGRNDCDTDVFATALEDLVEGIKEDEEFPEDE